MKYIMYLKLMVEVLVRNVIQQPFFRTFKKSTAPYKVHNMGLRYIILLTLGNIGQASSCQRERRKTKREGSKATIITVLTAGGM